MVSNIILPLPLIPAKCNLHLSYSNSLELVNSFFRHQLKSLEAASLSRRRAGPQVSSSRPSARAPTAAQTCRSCPASSTGPAVSRSTASASLAPGAASPAPPPQRNAVTPGGPPAPRRTYRPPPGSSGPPPGPEVAGRCRSGRSSGGRPAARIPGCC